MGLGLGGLSENRQMRSGGGSGELLGVGYRLEGVCFDVMRVTWSVFGGHRQEISDRGRQ